MGNQAIILIAGTLILVLVYTTGFMGTSNDLARNSSNSFAQVTAQQINTSAMEMAMRQLADSIKWRSTFSNLALFGGNATVTFKDTVVSAESCIVVRSSSKFIAGMDTGYASTRAVVNAKPGATPTIRAAFTAYSPSQGTLSDMYIDGRNYKSNGTTITASTGIYAISTTQSSYVNNPKAYLGGTTYTTQPATDIPTAYPEDARTVELNVVWPNGYPNTPDKALGLPAGTLKSIAQNHTVPGSQYITDPEDLDFPLAGVTYIEVPNGSKDKLEFKENDTPSTGIIVYHSAATDAEIDGLKTKEDDQPFKGLIIVDKIVHIHIDLLGGIILLAQNTNLGDCKGNKNHYIRYSSEVIQSVTQGVVSVVPPPGGITSKSWKDRLAVKSWYE